ncbi:hypothetical protein BJ878DRAFT_490888 [Calycina marina]|uniref:Uncharacterized protein n=1 Tax=Calycina marina TaxID=1763456 RepID=A0A9P7Z9I2_9HELO|nr:hypothetical protein BJ878DRAFT_490888 [Calycina marina]
MGSVNYGSGTAMKEAITGQDQRAINRRIFNSEQEQEWTAARCNRLLRALTARINLLKKDLARAQRPGVPATDILSKPLEKRRRSDAHDDDWKGNNARKKLKRTYSGRGGRPTAAGSSQSQSQVNSSQESSSTFVPGEISLPTPYLNRARGVVLMNSAPAVSLPWDSEDDSQEEPNMKRRGRPRKYDCPQFRAQFSAYMQQMKMGATTNVYNTYDGIYTALDSLLKATGAEATETRTKTKGPRPLFAQCLRAVPHCIAVEEKSFETERLQTGRSIDSRVISTEIYNDLESLGSSGRGWKHLKTIVRSHAIYVLKEAVSAGLLDVEFCCILVRLCIQTDALNEGETLLSAVLSERKFLHPPSITRMFGHKTTLPLAFLWELKEPCVSVTFRYQQLTRMISEDQLPLSWLATKQFGPGLTRAVQELSSDNMNTAIPSFLTAILAKLAVVPDNTGLQASGRWIAFSDAQSHTFSSLLTTMCAIAILSRESEKQERSSCLARETVKYEHIIRILRNSLTAWENSNGSKIYGALLSLANISVGPLPDDTHSEDELTQLLCKELRKRKGLLTSELAAFNCSIVRCCGRGTSTKGFRYLQLLQQKLEALAHVRESNGGNTLHELIVDSAFAFAQHTSETQHLEYAMNTEAKFHVVKAKHTKDETPRGTGGFRWEEGISEWVSVTPAVNKKKHLLGGVKKRNAPSLSGEVPDCDILFRPHASQRSSAAGVPARNRRSSATASPASSTLPKLIPVVLIPYHASAVTFSPTPSNASTSPSSPAPQSPDSSFMSTTSSATSTSQSLSSSFVSTTTCASTQRQELPRPRRRDRPGKHVVSRGREGEEDELSFCDSSYSSSHETQAPGKMALQDLPNVVHLGRGRNRPRKFASTHGMRKGDGHVRYSNGRRHSLRKTISVAMDGSADELGNVLASLDYVH